MMWNPFKKKAAKEFNDIKDAIIETPEQRRAKQFEENLEKRTQQLMKREGLDHDTAMKRVWAQIQRTMDKRRAKGTPVVCNVCGNSKCNAKTGPLMKNRDDTMTHKNCR